jgi:hypothetical protein
MGDEFCGMAAVLCPVCKHNVFHRKMTEIAICKVWVAKDGYHDDVDHTDNPVYDFKCAECGHDCTDGFGFGGKI